nr:outer membrane lipoprotein chaperone LolA [Sinobacterium norvegicum]
MFVAVSASVMARSDDGSSVQLSQLLAGTHSFQANFEQRLSDEDNQIMQQSSGTMIVINSGKLRWQTEQPFAQLVVTDGHKLWRYDEDLEQASVGSFSIDLAQTPAMILSGKVEELDQQYTVTGQIDEQSNGQFTLIPTSTNSLFDSLVIRFNQGRVSAMILLDGFGQTTDIQFSEVVVNAAVNDDLFSFTPPQGTDVLVEQ